MNFFSLHCSDSLTFILDVWQRVASLFFLRYGFLKNLQITTKCVTWFLIWILIVETMNRSSISWCLLQLVCGKTVHHHDSCQLYSLFYWALSINVVWLFLFRPIHVLSISTISQLPVRKRLLSLCELRVSLRELLILLTALSAEPIFFYWELSAGFWSWWNLTIRLMIQIHNSDQVRWFIFQVIRLLHWYLFLNSKGQ